MPNVAAMSIDIALYRSRNAFAVIALADMYDPAKSA
jgi:hypothetical protein